MKYFLTLCFCVLFAFNGFSQNKPAVNITNATSILYSNSAVSNTKPTKYLQNYYIQQNDYLSYYPIDEVFKNYDFKYTANDVAQYLYVEKPLLKKLNPNYNYFGGYLSDFKNNYTPQPKDFQPK